MAQATRGEEGKAKALDGAISQVEKKFGKGSIMKLGESSKVRTDAIPSGSISLDLALGIGGFPRGRMIEIFGPESSGKTTLVQHAIAEAQRMGGIAAFIDAEHALDPTYAKKTGVNIDALYISQPDYGEQALDIAEKLVASGAVDLVAIDSVAALVPRSELDGEMGDPQMGTQARLMSQAMRKLTALVSRTRTCMIFTNQIRERIGVTWGNPETTPGGRALKFSASVRIDIRREGAVKDGDEVVGNRVKVKIAKNKLAPPFKVAQFDILFGEGISKAGEIIDLGTEMNILSKKGAYYYYKDSSLGQGRENVRMFLIENPIISTEIESSIRASLGTSPGDGIEGGGENG
jgi:recombination protein RecA